MNGLQGLRKLTLVEFKLFLREHVAVFFALVFPPMLLVILGSIPAFREPVKDLGGLRMIDLYVPIVIALGLAFLALSTLPTALATYRERGILRRLATTPVRPAGVLLAQLVMSVAIAVVVMAVVVGIGAIAFDTVAPHNVIGFVAAFLLAAALFAIGLLIAAAAPGGDGGLRARRQPGGGPVLPLGVRRWHAESARPCRQAGENVMAGIEDRWDRILARTVALAPYLLLAGAAVLGLVQPSQS